LLNISKFDFLGSFI